ncbi:MAG TPA: tail fiber domain-containing protein [Methylomirabilota bacterium]|nr:tail fiber domain-containing protein [Methylomirabilota bacterium]
MKKLNSTGLIPLLLVAVTTGALAQTTAFTYQGRLNGNGVPASGTYDLQFTVYDSSGGATIVAGPLTSSALGISNGLFAITLDFGTSVFTGPARWLQIGVRTNGGGSFVALNPRQALTPAPYAIHAGTASNVANGAVVKSLNNLRDNITLAAGANVALTPSGNTLTIAATGGGGGGSPWLTNTTNIYYNAGRVGIGTTAPLWPLDVNGSMHVGSQAADGTPKLIHFGDLDFVSIGENTEDDRMELTAAKFVFKNGNVGIGTGTESPANKLTVRTPTTDYGIEHTDGTVRLSTFLGGSTGGGWLGTISNHKLSFFVNNSSAIMTIAENGNIGIGTANPSSLYKLDVVGSTVINLIHGERFFVSDSSDMAMLVVQQGVAYQVTAFGNLQVVGDATKTQGGTSWSPFSDRRLKQDVRAYEPGLNEILQLRPVRFHYRNDPKRSLTSAQEEVGFIAQEVREIIPDAIAEGQDGYLRLKADPIHWAAINAIQELNAKLKEQRAANAELKHRIEKLEQLMSEKNGSAK